MSIFTFKVLALLLSQALHQFNFQFFVEQEFS